MSVLRYCGGKLVSLDDWLPEHRFDYFETRGMTTGCNALRCTSCGGSVAAGPGDSRFNRGYQCACTRYSANAPWPVEQPINPHAGETLPWGCGGHPPLVLPYKLDGVELSETTDWVRLVRDVFSRALEPPLPHPTTRNVRGFWVQRLYSVLDEVPRRDVARAVASLILEPDPRVRVCVINFFDTYSRAPGVGELARAYRAQPELFLHVADPDSYTCSVSDWLSDALAKQIYKDSTGQPKDPLALEILKERALVAPGIGSNLYTLASVDRAWVEANAEAIMDAVPQDWSRVLAVLAGQPVERLIALAKRARGHGATREALIEFARMSLHSVYPDFQREIG